MSDAEVCVFLGPSLPLAQARAVLQATYLPPAAQGDVYRACKRAPRVLAIVDGYFDSVPAVWHKEILWALARGIAVFGASSMGALRAAELHAFGMRGVGQVFEAFHSGQLEDDDEVTVAHGDVTTGYRRFSEAMVNIRPTLARARQAGLLSPALHDELLSAAKASFYPERSYSALVARAKASGLEPGALAELEAFFHSQAVDQKAADTLQLLHVLSELMRSAVPSSEAPFFFANTEAWSELVEWADAQPSLVG
jgi:hypothetical protein